MKKYYLLLVLLFSFLMGFAQRDSLSLEEQHRREKNIQAGNPFKKFGYKPKISTLSQGKYLEFHDLDSVVQIGSFTYHVKKKVITGFIVNETKYSEATLRPEIISRWMSPDPLSEEFPSWSPYTFTNNNPIRFIDPTGLAPLDIVVTASDGTKLFTLDDGKEAITTVTAHQLYKSGKQWFEPGADNYLPLKSISIGASSDKLKHFTSNEIQEFADEDRWMISYRQGGNGDWKSSKNGADGFLLVTVDDMPYWADAIGQIPFAVDKVTDEIGDGKSVNEAVNETVKVGKEYGEGKLFGGRVDNSNTYDNYFILRGALNGATGRDFTQPITQEEAKKFLNNEQ